MESILDIAKTVVNDPYGNYFIQTVLEVSKPDRSNSDERSKIIDILSENLEDHYTQKYSSNVIVKAIETSSEPEKISLIEKIFSCSRKPFSLSNKYEIKVIQKCIDSMDLKMLENCRETDFYNFRFKEVASLLDARQNVLAAKIKK